MTWSEIIGGLAAFLTTISFIPQVWKIVRSRDTSSISLGMYFLFTTGVACWLAYGIMLNDTPIILANGVTFLLSLIILAFKIRHR